jgi:phosphatidylinositol-4,5-bisphosphate 3-kinase
MLSEEGHIFHIDFGHFLGHFKKKFGINRERVPFVLTEDFLCVIAGGAENPRKSPAFQEFQKLCGEAYISIRRHSNLLISLFSLMLPCGIAELQTIADVDYLRKTLAVDMDEKDALAYFQNR